MEQERGVGVDGVNRNRLKTAAERRSSGEQILEPGGTNRTGGRGEMARVARASYRHKYGRGQGLQCRKFGRGSPEVCFLLRARELGTEEDDDDVA